MTATFSMSVSTTMDAPAPNQVTIDPVDMTVAQVQAAFEAGLTSEALTKLFLDRIATFNPRYNAIITMNENALEDARTIDRRRAAGEALGPLAGVPVVIKDTMDMAGLPSTGGWRFLTSRAGGVDLIPALDSPVVTRMRQAGCVILGKTNVPVLSCSGSHANDSWAGPTLNAVAPDRVPGGSSAGTSTAVAASMAVLGLAEETSGSIQNPAAAQGLVGLKPTFALVPNTGVMPLGGSTLDVVGPIARCVRDAALTLDVLSGYTAEDPKTVAGIGRRPKGGYASALRPDALKGRRLGLYGSGWRDQPLSAATAALYRRAQDELVERSAILVPDPFQGSGFAAVRRTVEGGDPYDARGMESVAFDLNTYLGRLGPGAALKSFMEFAGATAQEDAFAPGGVLHSLHQLPQFAAALADPLSPPVLTEFLAARETYLTIFEAVFARDRLDALVFPQMRDPLPALHSTEMIKETTVSEINIAGLPGLTIPAGYDASGVPFNVIFVGPLWSEASLLAMAYDYEIATRHRRSPSLHEIA